MILDQLNIPSPCHEVETDWSKKADINLWMKRDDLIHPIISGNKWRKLSGILASYSRSEFERIVTFGGAFSNHLVATACASAILGISSSAIIRGEETKVLNPVLQLCALYGMNLQFVSREHYKETNRQSGVINGVLYIPEGGACAEGTTGCESILDEVDLQKFSKVFVACGTGTTIAGIANYLKKLGSNIRLNGIQVLKGSEYIKTELDEKFNIKDAMIYDDFHCGGYAKTSKELIAFIKDFSSQTGILLDPIYTGKMMLAIKKLIENGEIGRGECVLAIHTGGLTGWLGKHKELIT